MDEAADRFYITVLLMRHGKERFLFFMPCPYFMYLMDYCIVQEKTLKKNEDSGILAKIYLAIFI